MLGYRFVAVLSTLALAAAGLVLASNGPTQAALASPSAAVAAAASTYTVLGQPNLSSKTLGSRCTNPNARFNHNDFGGGGFSVDGPTGIAIGPRNRLFVADDGGKRILTWPNADALASCQPADQVIGAGQLAGPEAITVDGQGWLYVADTLDHTVKIFKPGTSGTYALAWTLGTSGTSGAGPDQFDYPRGLAVGEDGTLFVADDGNNRIEIFKAPFSNGATRVDFISGGADGGFNAPKALAMVGDSLFVADWAKSRVLRFTGPFDDNSVFASTATFAGVTNPVDLTVTPDGTLYVSDQDGAGGTSINTYRDATTAQGTISPTSTSPENTTTALGLATDAAGNLFIADYSSYRVVVRHSVASTGPIDASATTGARNLLAGFRARLTRAKRHVALGQEMFTLNHAKNAGYYREFYLLHKHKLPTPKIMSSELSFVMQSSRHTINTSALTTIKAHAKQGGIVSFDWHPDNPADPNTAHGDTTPLSTDQLASLHDPASPLGTVWRGELDRAAAALAPFQAAGIPIMFRPMMEVNLHYTVNGEHQGFWWGDDFSHGAALSARTTAFKQLWADMVHYLNVTKGLHNLLWIYSPNAPQQGAGGAVMDYFPGSSVVDMVGVDDYQQSLFLNGPSDRGLDSYQALVNTGKPFGLAEFGQGEASNQGFSWDARTLTRRVLDSYPATVWAGCWYSSLSGQPPTINGLPDLAHVSDLLKSPLLDVLPYQGVSPPVGTNVMASLTLSSSGRSDIARVTASRGAAGAAVSLYSVANGRRHRLATGKLNSKGTKTFTVTDKNGNGSSTRYVAVISATAHTLRAVTPIRSVK